MKQFKKGRLLREEMPKGSFIQKGSEQVLSPEAWICVNYMFQAVFDTRIKRLSITPKKQNQQFLLGDINKG